MCAFVRVSPCVMCVCLHMCVRICVRVYKCAYVRAPIRMMFFVNAHAGAAHQFQEYYRHGIFSKCETEIADMKFCLKLKAAPKDKAEVG